ncbi:MAG: DNA primase [Pseudomonadota bacterium]
MGADVLLARLDIVRRTGPGTWLARCPSHKDKTPSLSIRELDDGRVLVHDFAGCAVEDVLSAVGLTFDALFPERLGEFKPERRPFPAADVLRAVGFETLLVATAAGNIANGIRLSETDRQRLSLAAGRIAAAIEESGHG